MGDLGLLLAPFLTFHNLDVAIEIIGNDVPVMQESILFKTDINKSCLEPIFQVLDHSLVDAAYQTMLFIALDGKLLERSLLQHRNPGFQRFGIDDQFLVTLAQGNEHAFDPFDHLVSSRFDGFHNPLWGLVRHFHRLKRLLGFPVTSLTPTSIALPPSLGLGGCCLGVRRFLLLSLLDGLITDIRGQTGSQIF